MQTLTRRSFSEHDQESFAELSGDWNPLHVDAVFARRTLFGERLVHGVHQLLWALDTAYAAGHLRHPLQSVNARFVAAIGIGQPAVCTASVDDAGAFTLVVELDGKVAMRATGRVAAIIDGGSVHHVTRARGSAREWDGASIASAKGSLGIGYDVALAERMFPALTRAGGHAQVGALLACTRLVGMECPGQHSLFAGLTAEFADALATTSSIDWHIRPRGLQFGMAELELQGSGAHAILQALLRPKPREQMGMTEARALVEPNEFHGQRALVVGGSRGIGETVAKLIAAGGGDVAITYHAGATDALRVCDEIRDVGGIAQSFAYNVLEPTPFPDGIAPTHVYYFATPLIRGERSRFFSAEHFDQFSRFYVSGFANIILACLERVHEGFTAFYPSTEFLNDPGNDFVEYCAAKAAGESLCRQLEVRNPRLRIHAPRIPRVATDQTVSVATSTVPTTQSVMLDLLRSTRRG